MSASLIQELTTNSALPELIVVIQPTDTVSPSGAGDVLELADTKKVVSPNAVCKYINLRMQLATKNATDQGGWYEYVIALFDEQTTDPVVSATSGDPVDFSDINTQTLGDIAINLFRGKCLWNGAVPVGTGSQNQVLDLKIKLPNKWCKWKRGQYLCLLHYFRNSNTVQTTEKMSVIYSSQFKTYL